MERKVSFVYPFFLQGDGAYFYSLESQNKLNALVYLPPWHDISYFVLLLFSMVASDVFLPRSA